MALIGIMGGTFNPIHFGHIAIAKAAYEHFSLDEVWFMPNHIPGYKSNQSLVSGEKRLTMIELAIENYPYFKASDFELLREGKTYTYETLQLLRKCYPEDKFFFIMGADSLFNFNQWSHPEDIVQNATMLVSSRNNISLQEMRTKIEEMNEEYGSNSFHLIVCPEVPCSSSNIREEFGSFYTSNESKQVFLQRISEIIPLSVCDYILEQQLYIN